MKKYIVNCMIDIVVLTILCLIAYFIIYLLYGKDYFHSLKTGTTSILLLTGAIFEKISTDLHIGEK